MKEQMTEDQLVTLIVNQVDETQTYYNQRQSPDYELAMDYYYMRGAAIGECSGVSSSISSDVADSVDQSIAEMLPALTGNSGAAAEFEPINDEDTEQAELESQIVTSIIEDANLGYGLIRDGLFDALLLRNCAYEVYWDEKSETIDLPEYKQLDPQQVMLGVMQMQQNQDGVEREPVSVDENQDGTFNAIIREKKQAGFPKIDTIPLETLRINLSHDSINVDEAKFVAVIPTHVTQSDLIAEGYDYELVDSLPTFTGDGIKYSDEQDMDRSVRSIEIYRAYLDVDWDGDGIAEKRRVIIGGREKILENTEITSTQVITGSCWPMPHQWDGISLFDRMKPIQDDKTGLKRQIIDNNAYANLQRQYVVPTRVELDDVGAASKRSVVRVKGIGDSAAPIPVQPLDSATFPLYKMLDKERSERGGGALDAKIENMQVANTSAHGTERALSKMEQFTSVMTQNFAETVHRPMYLQVHRLLRQNAQGEMSFRVGNEYVDVDPSKWPARTKLNVRVGSSAGERARKQTAMLNVIAPMVEKLAASGSAMVGEEQIHSVVTDTAEAFNVYYPERYMLDPKSEEYMQKVQQQQQAAQMQEQQQQQMLMMQAQFQKTLVEMTEQTKQMKIHVDAMNDEADRRQKYEQMLADQEFKMTELELVHDKDVPGSAV